MLSAMGYPVFYSDDEAKKILVENSEIRVALIQLFGMEVYQNNQLNRPYLANKVFSEPNLLLQLNAIVHPAVRKAFENWSNVQDAPIVFNESALLFETGIYKNFDFTVLVTAPLDLRIDRVMKRDKATREAILSRISKQRTDEEKSKLADAIVENDDKNPLLPQVLTIIKKLNP